MKNYLKYIMIFAAAVFSTCAAAQTTDYIIKSVTGSVEYKLKGADDWKPAKRLLSVPKSSMLRIADGARVAVYSQANPQVLVIDTRGEHRLRTLIDEAEKKAAKSRAGKLADVFAGHSGRDATVRSGTSYRGPADAETLLPLYEAVTSPALSGNAPVALSLVKNSEGDMSVELSNANDKALEFALFVKIGGKYSVVPISGDEADKSTLTIPAGATCVVPDCTLAHVEDMEVVAVASPDTFDPRMLTLILNSPSEVEKTAAGSAIAVRGVVR